MNEKRKIGIPFAAVMAMVIMAMSAAIIIDGICVQKLPMNALSYPMFCAAMVFVAGFVEIVRAFRDQKAASESAETAGGKKTLYVNRKNFLISVGLFAAYVVLMWLLGFVISSIAVTAAFVYVFKAKKPLLVVLCSAVVIVLLYILFNKALYIFLPKGLLFGLVF